MFHHNFNCYTTFNALRSLNSSVGIVSGYELVGRSSIPSGRQVQSVYSSSGSTQPSFLWVLLIFALV
jgi:hypothetical protein